MSYRYGNADDRADWDRKIGIEAPDHDLDMLTEAQSRHRAMYLAKCDRRREQREVEALAKVSAVEVYGEVS